MCWSYNRQYGTRYICAMPTNLYGPGDNYDLKNSHVLPALIRKVYEAKINGFQEVVVWGTGNSRREFLYSDDVANACLYLMQNNSRFGDELFNKKIPPIINIGFGSDLTIRNLAEIVKSVIGFEGRLVFDDTKPDGTPRKLLDISILKKYGWTASVMLEDGVVRAYKDFLERQHNV
jgi:GDP-L-fucose synthase